MRAPRPYQLACVEQVRKALGRKVRGVVVEQPTGIGKAFEIAMICKLAMHKGKRVLVAVNRDNLCDQLFASLKEQGLFPVMERGLDIASPLSDLVCGSFQTMQGKRLQKWNVDHFHLVITDECHGSGSPTFKRTLDHFSPAYHVGFSATLERHDKEGLWSGFTERVFAMTIVDAWRDGWLVEYEHEEIPVPITMSEKLAGKKTFSEEDEIEVFSSGEYLPRLFAETAQRAHGRRGLLFWPNVDSSKAAAEHFNANGIETKHADGYMEKEEIREILAWFREGGPRCLMNSKLLEMGYDNPMIDAVGIMRITQSIPSIKQMVGRATRANCVIDGLPNAEARRAAIAASVKPKFKLWDLMIQIEDMKHSFADVSALITSDPGERSYLKEEEKQAGRQLTLDEIECKLKARRETDAERQLAKLAEDAANSARKREALRTVYVGDILLQPVGQRATDKHVSFIRNLIRQGEWNVRLGDGPFTGWQLHRIKDRIENKAKKLTKANA